MLDEKVQPTIGEGARNEQEGGQRGQRQENAPGEGKPLSHSPSMPAGTSDTGSLPSHANENATMQLPSMSSSPGGADFPAW